MPGSEYTFDITFGQPEPAVQYVAAAIPMPITFANNSAGTFNLSGFLPAVQLTNLDHPFTVNNIPVSQTDPNLTAYAIQNYFEQGATTYSSGQAPFNFPPPNRINPTTVEAPYIAPVPNNNGTNLVPQPVTVVNPTITVAPVVLPNGSLSYTEFDITFTGVSGAQSKAAMVVSNTVDENGVGIGTNSTALVDNTVTIPTGSTASSVQILKQSGNEFRVNPIVPPSVFTPTTTPEDSDQPAVAMSSTGSFVIAWRGAVSQQVAPKDVTDIYFRRYQALGDINSFNPGTYVPGTVISDIVTPGEAATDPAEYAAQAFTGVQILPNPTIAQVQQITFGAAVAGTTFQLQIGAVLTSSITFNANNLAATVLAIQNAIIAAGYPGTIVTYVPPSVPPAVTTSYNFTVTFGGASTGVDVPPIQYVAAGGAPPVSFTQSLVTPDLYTELTNVNYTNPQFNPAVAVDIYGNFTIVWANQGQDVSFFNNISMQRYDKLGNALGGQVTVNFDYTNIDFAPDLAIGPDGNSVVTWSETPDASYLTNEQFVSNVYVRGFSAQGAPLWFQVAVPDSGGYSTIAMDGQDNFEVVWQTAGLSTDDTVYNTSPTAQANVTDSVDVYGAEYQLLNYATGQPLPAPLALRAVRNGNPAAPPVPDRLNSGVHGNNNPAPAGPPDTWPNTVWPYDDYAADVQMDVDGDIAATYYGDGPAVSSFDLDIPASFFKQYFPNNPNLPNGDLLPYFNPYPHTSPSGFVSPGDALGLGATTLSDLYLDNWDVESSIDQVLFDAEYPATIGSTATPATTEQAGRLRAILESVAGELRGEANGVLLSQWDANPPNEVGPTFSDSVVNTQRDGVDQRYYITIPADVQQGSFQLDISPLGSTTAPADNAGLPPLGYVETPLINMPALVGAQPGGPIDIGKTEQNIANAINSVMGQFYNNTGVTFSGSVAVRLVGEGPVAEITVGTGPTGLPTRTFTPVPNIEADARVGTAWQIPDVVTAAETPTTPITPANALSGPGESFIIELIFQGQAHDEPLLISATNIKDQQWIGTPVQTQGAGGTTTTYTYALGGASPVVVSPGDFTGNQGSAQYNASLAMSSAGDMVSTYTDQALQTDGITIPSDAAGNPIYSNIYYERLAESTDTAGPKIVGWNSANGVDLLPKLSGIANAIGVNSQYFVLTFDEPMLAGDPTLNPDSVYDLSNYQLYNSSGTQISNAFTHVDYGLSEVAQVAAANGNGLNPIPDNRWEVVLTINGGTTPLPDGTYTLTVLNAIPSSSTTAGQTGLRDIYGTPLNLTGYNPTGSDFTSTVTITQSVNAGQIPQAPGLTQTDQPINNNRGGQQVDPAVASTNNFSTSKPAQNGNYVVVWTSIVNGATNIVGELFQPNGTQIGPEFVVNNTASASWGSPDVAMDATGNFVVTWSGAGPNSSPTTSPSDAGGVITPRGSPSATSSRSTSSVPARRISPRCRTNRGSPWGPTGPSSLPGPAPR